MGKDEEAHSPETAEQLTQEERTMRISDHVASYKLDRREWQLGVLEVVIILVLAAGVAVLTYPSVFAEPVVFRNSRPSEFRSLLLLRAAIPTFKLSTLFSSSTMCRKEGPIKLATVAVSTKWEHGNVDGVD